MGDIVGLANFARFIYEQCDEIPYMDLCRLVADYRGNRNCTVKDVMEMRRYVTMELVGLESRLAQMENVEKNIVAMEELMEEQQQQQQQNLDELMVEEKRLMSSSTRSK